MNSRTLSTISIVGFLLLGGVAMGLRYQSLREERIAREDSHWELIYSVKFDALIAGGEQALVTVALPFETEHCTVLNKNEQPWTIRDPNLRGQRRGPYKYTGNRVLELSTRQAKPEERYEVLARFILRVSPRADRWRRAPLETLSPDARTRFLKPEPPTIPIQSPVVRQKVDLVPSEGLTEAERLQWIFNYCADIDSGTAQEPGGDDVEGALSSRHGSAKARARAMVTLCRAIGIPSRLVTGFRIQQGSNLQPHVWVEVFQEPQQAWVPFDPTGGWSLKLPMDFVPVRRGGDEVFSAINADNLSSTYAIKRLPPDARVLRGEMEHPAQILDLTRLPVPMHPVMKILLLLPFAALITAFLRNVVGLGTFGTFSPALLAMSFIFADLTTGLAILVIVIAVGLFGRTYLERLRLLTVPRLSIILTMVILCVVFGLSLLHYMLPSISAEVVLLPMVILTMLIERFHVSLEEDGLIYTIQLAAGTLLVALLCYLVLKWQPIGELVLTYPEAHFFTLAAFIVLGRYAGYRLTELWRFRDLVEPSEPAR